MDGIEIQIISCFMYRNNYVSVIKRSCFNAQNMVIRTIIIQAYQTLTSLSVCPHPPILTHFPFNLNIVAPVVRGQIFIFPIITVQVSVIWIIRSINMAMENEALAPNEYGTTSFRWFDVSGVKTWKVVTRLCA